MAVKPSKYDRRDHVYRPQNIGLSQTVDLRLYDTPVESQGMLNSCVAAAAVGAYELMVKKNFPEQLVDLSKLYAYWHGRLLEDSEYEDGGIERIRNVLKGMNKFGVCREEIWPYVSEQRNIQPDLECYVDSWPRKISSYTAIYSIGGILEVIDQGFPVLTGITVFDNFMQLSGPDSIVSVPAEGLTVSPMAHAMVLVGYSQPSQWFIAKNSYGPEWGDQGYCYVPFDYLTQFGFDQWYFKINM